MAEGRQRHTWVHTSSLLALIANANRDPKKTRAFKPSDFDPYAKSRRSDRIVINKDNIALLRKSFITK